MILSLEKLTNRSGMWVLLFFVLTLLTQSGSMWTEVFDWDESTFILLAGELVDGKLPYVENFDNKPPGIFFLLAAAMVVFGETLWTVRLLGDVFLFGSAVAVYYSVVTLTNNRIGAGVAGIALIALHVPNIGQFTGTGLVAAGFLSISLWALIAVRDRLWGVAVAALALSLAVLVRSNLAICAVAIAALLLILTLLRPGSHLTRTSFVVFVLSGLAPLALVVLLYAYFDGLVPLRLALWDVPLSYSGGGSGVVATVQAHVQHMASAIRMHPFLYPAVGLLSLIGMGLSAFLWTKQAFNLLILWTMFLFVIVSVLLSGNAFPHYWLQLFPFVAVFCGLAIILLPDRIRVVTLICVSACLAIASFPSLPRGLKVFVLPKNVIENHVIRAAAEHIEEIREPDDQVWAVHRHLVLWYLNMPPISPVATHPSNVTTATIVDPLVAAGYIEPDPLRGIYESQPRFVVTLDEEAPRYVPDADEFAAFLDGYELSFERRGVQVYQRLEARN